jgi:hypothetical protein
MASSKHLLYWLIGLLGCYQAHFVATLEHFAIGINFTYEMLITLALGINVIKTFVCVFFDSGKYLQQGNMHLIMA